MKKHFSGRYEIDDGYTGSRPQHFPVRDFEIEDDMSDDDLLGLYREMAYDYFKQLSIFTLGEDEFLEWARSVIAEREAQDRGEGAA